MPTRSTATLAALATAFALTLALPATAQRGTGDDEGVARGADPYFPEPLAGSVVEVVVTECPESTGRFDTGVHVTADVGDEERAEVHLGPEPVVQELTAALDPGDAFRAEVFRTDPMPLETFVALIVVVDGETFQLRDPDTLQPRWARGSGAGRSMPQGGCWWAMPTPE